MVNNCNKNIFKNVVFADIAGFLSDSYRASGRFQPEQYDARLKELGRTESFLPGTVSCNRILVPR